MLLNNYIVSFINFRMNETMDNRLNEISVFACKINSATKNPSIFAILCINKKMLFKCIKTNFSYNKIFKLY